MRPLTFTTVSFFGLTLAALLTSCSRSQTAQQSPRYQIAIAPSGQVYRLDTTSGEVIVIDKAAVISDNRTRLAIGSLYVTEHGDVLRYSGEGKFEPRPPLSSFFK